MPSWLIQLNGMSLNVAWPDRTDHRNGQKLPHQHRSQFPLASDRSEPFRSTAACSAALFVRVDWVSKRPSELYPRSALIYEAFDFGAGVPNPMQ